MTTAYAIEEIKKDVEELTKIVIEDKISKVQIHNHRSTDKVLEEIRKYSGEQIAASEIIGRTIISKRFAEKILCIISKYHSRPHDLRLLIYTAMLLYNDQKQATEKA